MISHFSRSRDKNMSNFSPRISRDQDSCQCPVWSPPFSPHLNGSTGSLEALWKMEKVFNWAFSSSTISLSSLVISSFTLVYLSLHHIATLKMMTLERWGQVRRLGRKYWLFDCAVPHCHLVCHLARCFDILSLFYSAVQQWDIWCVWHSEHVTVKRSHWKNLMCKYMKAYFVFACRLYCSLPSSKWLIEFFDWCVPHVQ